MSCKNSSTSSLLNVNETSIMSYENVSILSSTNNESKATKISSKITSTLSPTDNVNESSNVIQIPINNIEDLTNITKNMRAEGAKLIRPGFTILDDKLKNVKWPPGITKPTLVELRNEIELRE